MRATKGIIVLGTIVQPLQVNKSTLQQAFEQNNVEFVLLMRSNVFDQFVSQTIAQMVHQIEESTNVSFSEAYQRVKGRPFHASVAAFKAWARRWKSCYHYLITEMKKRDIHPLVISYETMILRMDMTDLYSRLLHNFLELGSKFETRNANLPAKQEKGCTSKKFQNFEMFAKAVRSLKWSREPNPIPACLA